MLYQFRKGDSFVPRYKVLIFLGLTRSMCSPESVNIIEEDLRSEYRLFLVSSKLHIFF